MGRTEELRTPAFVRHQVHRDDLLGAGDPGSLQRTGTDTADADDRIAGLHAGRVDGRTPSGRDPAADEAGTGQLQGSLCLGEDLACRGLGGPDAGPPSTALPRKRGLEDHLVAGPAGGGV